MKIIPRTLGNLYSQEHVLTFSGSLHFSYAQTDDQSARDEKYKCAMSNVDSSVIKLGNENSLQVNSNGSSSKPGFWVVYVLGS